MNERDRRTDGRTDTGPQQRPRLRIVSPHTVKTEAANRHHWGWNASSGDLVHCCLGIAVSALPFALKFYTNKSRCAVTRCCKIRSRGRSERRRWTFTCTEHNAHRRIEGSERAAGWNAAAEAGTFGRWLTGDKWNRAAACGRMWRMYVGERRAT